VAVLTREMVEVELFIYILCQFRLYESVGPTLNAEQEAVATWPVHRPSRANDSAQARNQKVI
jgi:hypothetical protein